MLFSESDSVHYAVLTIVIDFLYIRESLLHTATSAIPGPNTLDYLTKTDITFYNNNISLNTVCEHTILIAQLMTLRLMRAGGPTMTILIHIHHI